MKKRFVKSLFCCVIFMLSAILLSCGENAGLGASVDTESPTIAIEYPPIAAVIRDTFTLYGSCSDDKGVASVTVKVTNTSTKEVVDTLSATVSADGKSWSANLNEYDSEAGKWKYLDGSYQFSVEAVDGAGRKSGENSRTFDIDNTPPVFVISNPGVVKSEGKNPSAYGSLFTIEGTIADDHSIALMDVKIYDSNGVLVSSETYDGQSIDFYREEEIATAGGTSVIIAQYANGTTSTMPRYAQLYDTSAGGTQTYYAEVTLRDSALVYKTPTDSSRSAATAENDSLGNSTSTVYLYDSVYTSLMSAKKGLGLSAADLKNLLNGTKTDKPEALTLLNEKAVDTSADTENRLSFSLNPDASPKYQVNGFAFEFDEAQPLQTASSGNSLTVTVSAGLDGTQILPEGDDKEGVKVWLKKYADRPTDETSVKNDIKTLVGKVNNLIKDEKSEFDECESVKNGEEGGTKVDDWILVYDYASHLTDGKKGSSVTTKTFSLTLPKDIELSTYYILALTGCDIEDVDFAQDTVYGFEGNQQGVAPTLKIESPANLSITNNPGVVFSGTAKVNSGNLYVKELKATITVMNEETAEDVGTFTETITCTSTNSADGTATYTWSSQNEAGSAFTWDTTNKKWIFRPSEITGFDSVSAAGENAAGDGKQYLYTLKIEGASSSGHKSEISTSVHIDRKMPSVTITSAEPRVSSYAGLKDSSGNDISSAYNYLNGTVTIKGSIEEQNLKEVTYDFWVSTDLTATLSESDSLFEKAKNNSAIAAALEAAGMDGSLGKVYSINQEFDTTKITALFEAITGKKDPKLLVEVVLMAEDTAVEDLDAENSHGNKIQYLASLDPVLNGEEKNDDGSIKTPAKKFVICQETDRPFMTFGNADSSITTADGVGIKEEVQDGKTVKVNKNLFGTTNDNKLQVTFEDDDAINSVWVTLFDSNGDELADEKTYYGINPYKLGVGKTTYTLNYQLPPTDGVYKVRVDIFDSGATIPTDLSGADSDDSVHRNTSGNFFIAVDSGAPNIKISSPSKGSYHNKPITVKGTVSKQAAVTISGSVKKGDDDVSDATVSDVTISTTKNTYSLYDWSAIVTLPAGASGDYDLIFEAKDGYNQSTSDSVRVGADNAKPEWDASKFYLNKSEELYANTATEIKQWCNSESVSFSGAWKEAHDGSGIDSVYWKVIKAGDKTTQVPAKLSDFGKNTFVTKRANETDDFETFSQNLGEFVVKTDDDGNPVPNTVYMMAVDKAENESSIQTFYVYVDFESPTVSSDQSGSLYSNTKKEISVSGSASDDSSGVKTVSLSVTLDGSSTPLEISTGKTEIPATVTAAATETDPNNKTWSAEIPPSFLATLEDKTYAVKATVTDDAGNKSTQKIFSIKIDSDDPVISDNISLSDEGGVYSVYKNPDTAEYYAYSGSKFSISGSIEDEKSGIAEDGIKVYANLTETQLTDLKKGTATGINSIKTASQLPITDINLSSYSDSEKVKLTIIATDNAGNTKDKTLTVNIDNSAPTPLHAIDTKQKDVFFRIGENDNDDIDKNTVDSNNKKLWDDNLDKDVGGKYSEGTYGNSKTIKIRGTVADGGSGVAMIYYKVITDADLKKVEGYAAADTKPALDKVADNFVKNYKTDKTGYFAPGVIDADKNRRVFYTGALKNARGDAVTFSTTSGDYKDFVAGLGTLNTTDTTKSYATVESNYNSVLSGFSKGRNYLFLVVVDNVGNPTLDSVKSGELTYHNISINVDQTPPDAKSYVTGVKYTNKAENTTMEFTGEASDEDAGLYSITLQQGEKEITVKKDDADGKATNDYGTLEILTRTTVDKKDTKWTWKATVKNDKFFDEAENGDTVSVSLEAKDAAGIGNTKSITVATVIIDTKLDSITLTAPSDAEADVEDEESTLGIQINGTITLEGTIGDKNALPETAIDRIEYSTDNSNWANLNTKADSLELSGNYSFKAENFDTTKLDDGTYYLRAVGKDSAGNEKESDSVTVIVSQDSDRPKVKINNLTPYGNSYTLMYGTNAQVTGSVSDDDATSGKVVKEFWMTEYPVTVEKNADGTLKKNTDGTYSVIETLSDNSTRTAVNKRSSWNVSTGEFIFEPTDKDDGPKHFYILVIDNTDHDFYTTATKAGATEETTVSDTLKLPKVTVTKKIEGAAEPTPAQKEQLNGTVFSYSSDHLNPTVGLTEGLPYAENTATAKVAEDDKGVDFAITTATKPTTNASLNSSFKAGGFDRRYVKFYFTANDASGIAGMTVEFKDDKGNSLKKLATEANIGGVDTANGTFHDSDDKDTDATWLTDYVDLSEFKDSEGKDFAGQISVSVTPYDKAGLAGNGSCNFYVDNLPPKIEKIEPKSGSEISGDVEISGKSDDNGVAGTKNIQWLIPTTAQVAAYKTKTTDAAKKEYLADDTLYWNGGEDSLEKDSSLTLWKFVFDGKYDEGESIPAQFKFKKGNPKLDVYDIIDDAANNVTGYAESVTEDRIYTLPVWFKATDALGNVAYETSYKYRHNPDADKPKLEFTYPTKENYITDENNNKFAVLGGTIRVTGSAIIPSGQTTVGSIYYQIADSRAGYTGTFDIDEETATADEQKTDVYKAKKTYGLTVVSVYDVINKMRGTTLSKNSTLSEEFISGLGFKTKDEIDAWWGIEATGTASWNFKLNEDGKLNPTSGTNNITLRACGVNAEGKFGVWTSGDNEIKIHIDKNAPVITAAVNKYNGGTAKITKVPDLTAQTNPDELSASMSYDSDMYLKGCWTLVATLLDETRLGGENITPYSVMIGETPLSAGTGYYVENNVHQTGDDDIEKNGVRLYIPIPKDSESVEITVNASDAEHTSTQKYTFKIDEQAPTLDKLTGNSLAFDAADEAKKCKSVEDSNYRFTLAGSSYDSVSGVKNIVFYYMRKQGTTTPMKSTTSANDKVLDPMTWNDETASKVAMDDLTPIEFTQEDDTYYLYAKTYSGTATADTFIPDTAYDAHVRNGGLVYIDGVLRTITKIEEKEIEVDGEKKKQLVTTFTPALSAPKTSVTAYFPIAQVIDNSASEKVDSYSGETFTIGSGDDGDDMPESFTKSGSTWTWDAAIRSNNMPDGPVSLVILAFDNAGNVFGKTINTKITNKAPRIAKVFLGTDLNGDGNYTNSDSIEELVEYDILGAEGKEQSAHELDFNATTPGKNNTTVKKYKNGIFTIKDGLAVVPEIVGGNGEIAMILDTSATSPDAVPKSAAKTLITKTSAGTVVTEKNDDDEDVDTVSKSFTGKVSGVLKGSDVVNSMYSFVIDKRTEPYKDKDPFKDMDGDNKGMSFTFWDETEETEQGTSSQNAVLYVKNFKIAQTDSTAPTVVVNPFFWDSSEPGENSLYYPCTETTNETTGKVTRTYDTSKVLGHIELEGDLSATTFPEATTTGEFDRDPKVSGKIRFTGTAYDNFRLGSIWIKFDDYITTAVKVAEYKNTAAANQPAAMEWVVTDKTIADGYVFKVEDTTLDEKGNKAYYGHYDDEVYFGQKGHKVYWTLDLDTEKISSKAKTDVKLTVTAKGAIDNKETAAAETKPGTDATTGARIVTDGTTNVPSYRMDVVPYITAIHTEDRTHSGLKDNNIRSASGKYSILKKSSDSENKITVEGFNFHTKTANLKAKIAVNSPNSTSSAPYGTGLLSTTADTAATGTHLLGLTVTAGSTTNSFTITNTGISRSGYLEVFSNGVRTLNNLNNNNAHGSFAFTGEEGAIAINDYKNMPNRANEADFYTTKNVKLTDDRYLRVFDMKDTGIKNGYYPVMMMGQTTKNQQLVTTDNPVFGYVDLNGINSLEPMTTFQDQCYQPQRMEYDVSQGKVSYIEYLIGGLSWDQMAMARDSSGRYMHGSVYNYAGDAIHLVYNRYAEQHTWTYQNFYRFTDGWGYTSKYDGYRGNQAESTGNNAITLEKTNYGTNGTLIGRYQGMKLKVKGDSTSTAGAVYYMAYFDDNTTDKELIFRTFNIGSNNTSRSHQLKDGYTNLTEQATATTVTGRIRAATGATKYLDLGVTSTGYAVIVYYDKNGNLRLVHSDSAVDGSITGTTFSATNVEFTPYIGQYVSMAIDSGDHIHIAAFDANKSTLRYIYLEDYSDTEPDEYTVDASTSVGKWTQIKIHPTSGKPYIAYYNNAEDGQKESIKLAYLSAAARADGYDANDYATGSWEYMTVPALTPPQGGDAKFQAVCLDFDSANRPVVGYLGTNLEFGKWLDE